MATTILPLLLILFVAGRLNCNNHSESTRSFKVECGQWVARNRAQKAERSADEELKGIAVVNAAEPFARKGTGCLLYPVDSLM